MVARCGSDRGLKGGRREHRAARRADCSPVRGNKTRGSKTRVQTNLEITPAACTNSLSFSLTLALLSSSFFLFLSLSPSLSVLNSSHLLIINYFQMRLVPPSRNTLSFYLISPKRFDLTSDHLCIR